MLWLCIDGNYMKNETKVNEMPFAENELVASYAENKLIASYETLKSGGKI